MTDNKKTNIDNLLQQIEVSAQLADILAETDKAVLQKMVEKLATIAAITGEHETFNSPDELARSINAQTLAVFITAYTKVTGHAPHASLLERLNP